MSSRTIVIGDIHGCSTALATLLDAISPEVTDTIILLGDYIDRGPDSKGVLDLLVTLSRRCHLIPLLGNHEELLLGSLRNQEYLRGWLACGGVEALASYGVTPQPESKKGPLRELIPEDHWTFLVGCQDYFETDSHLFTHAGYEPDLPLDRQPGEALRWRSLSGWQVRSHVSGKVAVVGHTPQRSGKILDLGFLVCIDTLCHGGRWLTALEVNTRQVWQSNQRGKVSGQNRRASG